MISGVIVKHLKKIPDDRGTIMKMQESCDDEFKGFGEIYFSTIYPGVVKGWHLHKNAVLNYAVIKGMIKLVLFDARKDWVQKVRFRRYIWEIKIIALFRYLQMYGMVSNVWEMKRQ